MAERIPSGTYLVLSVGHPVSGVLVDEDRGEIRIPFAGLDSAGVAMQHLTVTAEQIGYVIAGVVENDADPGRIQAIANAADYGVP